MSESLKKRITELAGRVVVGASIKQAVKAKNEAPKDPTQEQLDEARTTALAFADRLRSLSQTRFQFDLAVQVQRSFRNFDIASSVAKNEPLPDPAEVDSAVRRSKFQLEAVWQLVNREVEQAAKALSLLRSNTMRLAHRAKNTAVESIACMLPLGAFDNPHDVAQQSRLVKRANSFIMEMETVQGISLVTASLFGVRMPAYRIEEVPEGPQVMPCDKLDPNAAAESVEGVVVAHDRAEAFLASILDRPGDAMKETGTQA